MAVILFAVVYTHGWFAIRKTRPTLFSTWRLTAFLLGLAIIWLAIASPLDGFADASLSAHMVEHLLLMSFVPPLLLLGYPVVPLLRGLPHAVTAHILAPFIRSKFLRRLGGLLVMPIVAWLVMNLIFLGWHIPTAYDFALEHERWHDFEHICFLGSSILFWWPIIRPWPSHTHRTGWSMLLYLVTADIVNTALSAFLAFCDRPVYSYYYKLSNPFHISPMSDQMAGAVMMWVMGSLVFLVAIIFITLNLLQSQKRFTA
ncbi:cytochrome c oxidase assembly protein [Granulicella arctica]|nr:cytochrome c oxidase assembly protein [Granulicella arctica]